MTYGCVYPFTPLSRAWLCPQWLMIPHYMPERRLAIAQKLSGLCGYVRAEGEVTVWAPTLGTENDVWTRSQHPVQQSLRRRGNGSKRAVEHHTRCDCERVTRTPATQKGHHGDCSHADPWRQVIVVGSVLVILILPVLVCPGTFGFSKGKVLSQWMSLEMYRSL
jgi:hypothetical protein